MLFCGSSTWVCCIWWAPAVPLKLVATQWPFVVMWNICDGTENNSVPVLVLILPASCSALPTPCWSASSHKTLLVSVPRSHDGGNINKFSLSTPLCDAHLFSLGWYSSSACRVFDLPVVLGRFRVRLAQGHCPKGSARTKTQLLIVLCHSVGEKEDAGKIQMSQIS